MKVTTNPQTLTSLNSLLDPGQRQQQTLQDQQDRKDGERVKNLSTDKDQVNQRQSRIAANREALAKLQERLRTDRIKKLQDEFSFENLNEGSAAQNANPNLRESFASSRPADSRPGQIIDIRV